MNVSKKYKSILLQLTCCLCLIFSASAIFCISISKNPLSHSHKIVNTLNDEKLNHCSDKINAQYLVRASEIFLLQIKYAQLAQTNASTVDVKELGKMNEKFYTKKYLQLITTLQSKKYSIPTSLNPLDEDRVSNLFLISESTFDEKLCNETAQYNNKAIHIFENLKFKTMDSSIEQMSINIIPELYAQKRFTYTCQNKFQ